MAFTFLQAVNDTLKRHGTIAGSAGELTTFTDTGFQGHIDLCIQVWNEVVHELYSFGTFHGEQKEGTLTLATDTTTYATPSDFEQMSGETWETAVMVNTGNFFMREYPGGHLKLYADQPDPSDFTGRPRHWVLDKTGDNFKVDSTPTADENGDAYTFLYDKEIALTTTTDTFPFTDTVVRALTPVVAELMRIDDKEARLSSTSFRRALKYVREKNDNKEWGFAHSR